MLEKKRMPDIFYYNSNYWLCSENGKNFLEKHAQNQCEFIPINFFHLRGSRDVSPKKTGKRVDGNHYWVNILRRYDSILWSQSTAVLYETMGYDRDTKKQKLVKVVDWPPPPIGETGRGLTIRRAIIGDTQVWHEDLSGAYGSTLIFVTNELHARMVEEKIGVFDFISVSEV